MTHTNTPTHPTQKPAVLLVNLGTPTAPTPQAVRTFLREFLTDTRVIEYPQILWRPLLETIILRTRPKKVAHAYTTIWTDNGSPLLAGTHAQITKLRKIFNTTAEIRHAMCYGNDNLDTALTQLHAEGYRKVLILPAYPQYSATTVGAVNDIIARWILRHRDQLELRLIRAWGTHPTYINALATAIENHWKTHGRPNFTAGERIIASFHSIPTAMKHKGDPYHDECEHTATLLRQRLGLTNTELLTTYQSVFGPAQWIGPATIDTITTLGQQHTPRIDVICPGFISDCLETLEEINIQNRNAFHQAGGKTFHYIPWGNGQDECITTLATHIRDNISGW